MLCTPNAVPGIVNSLINLEALSSAENSTIHAVKQHKQIWAAVRLASGNNPQPFVVAGDVMLSDETTVTDEECQEEQKYIVVSRLYDIGRSALQLSTERLTSVSNAYAVKVEVCENQAAVECVATAMSQGHVVLPPSYALVGTSGVLTSSINVPATASQWVVHWTVNPELSIYSAYFQFCRDSSQFAYEVHSSWGRARVWTLHTMSSVDFESEGVPSATETASRVSYMRIPDFFEPGQDSAGRTACDAIVGLRIVGVESEGMWPDDTLLYGGSWAGFSDGLCPASRLVPAFGKLLVMPWVATVSIIEVVLDAVCTLTAAMTVHTWLKQRRTDTQTHTHSFKNPHALALPHIPAHTHHLAHERLIGKCLRGDGKINARQYELRVGLLTTTECVLLLQNVFSYYRMC